MGGLGVKKVLGSFAGLRGAEGSSGVSGFRGSSRVKLGRAHSRNPSGDAGAADFLQDRAAHSESIGFRV